MFIIDNDIKRRPTKSEKEEDGLLVSIKNIPVVIGLYFSVFVFFGACTLTLQFFWRRFSVWFPFSVSLALVSGRAVASCVYVLLAASTFSARQDYRDLATPYDCSKTSEWTPNVCNNYPR